MAASTAVAATLLLGCATTVAPSADALSAAVTAIDRAAGAGGNSHAPQEMQQARSKLQRAQTAMAASENSQTLAMLREAQVDAQLAEAKSEAAKARQAANAARESNRVLSEEIQRKTP
jgi:galactokinase